MNVRKRVYRSSVWVMALLLWCTGVLAGSVQAASSPIAIVLDGKRLTSDVAPYIVPKANVTLVPLRVISESIGAAVDWNPSAKSVTIRMSGTTIVMRTGQKYATVNGGNIMLDITVQTKQGRTMVPLRFVGEQLGLAVNWDSASRTITLLSAAAGGGSGRSGGVVGAWISTVYNLDWPSAASYGNAEMQKAEFAALLDKLQAMGVNTVFVQVRPAADALYPSRLVPWSKALTGVQGADPGYDPLAYMIEQTHLRGMKFEAWFNPFRATTDGNTSALDPSHVALSHPEWIVKAGGKDYINPGIPEARRHIIDVIMEVVNGYEIDGVHLDDYFYPSGVAFADDDAFATYNNGGFADKADWRRDNINRFVRELGEAIHAAKPQVRFGISPFGVWRNKSADKTGSDTKAGVSAYDDMYADVRTWIREEWIDYVVPQIYWSLSFSAARYDVLTDWWANEVKGTNVDLYIGHAPYKLGTSEAGWQTAQEIVNQLKYNESVPEVKGDVFFSAKDLLRNPLGVADALKQYYGLK